MRLSSYNPQIACTTLLFVCEPSDSFLSTLSDVSISALWSSHVIHVNKCNVIFHPFIRLSYDRSISSSKASFPHSASSFHFHHPFVFWTSSGSCLPPHLPVTFIIPSLFPLLTCFSGQFVHKTWAVSLPPFHCLYDIPFLPDYIYMCCPYN